MNELHDPLFLFSELNLSPKPDLLKLSQSIPIKKVGTAKDNRSQLKILNDMIEDIKKKGLKYSFIACTFLTFYKAGKDTLPRVEIERMLEEEIVQNKDKIISSFSERSCILDANNYKKKLRDILKKKKWFSKRINENKEIEYTMLENIVSPSMPRIISQLKSLNISKDNLKKKEIVSQTKKKYGKELYSNNIKYDFDHGNDDFLSNLKLQKDEESESETKLTGNKRKASDLSLDMFQNDISQKLSKNEEKDDNINNEDTTNVMTEEERNVIENKVNSFFDKCDSLLRIYNNINDMTKKKINSIQNNILEKQKEIDTQKLILEKLMLNNQKYKLYDKKEIEDIIIKLKNYLEEYKNKMEVLSLYQKYITGEQKEDEIKSVLSNTKLVHNECVAILDKFFTDLSKLFNEYVDFEDLCLILFDNKDDDWLRENLNSSNNKDYIKTNIDNLKSILNKRLNQISSNINMISDENINSVSYLGSNTNSD